jgi:hypothetical protein
MGMTVEASSASRSLAELATGAVDDDTRQDEDHAGDPEDVGEMLRAEPVMAGVRAGHQVHGDIEGTCPDHHHEPELAEARDPTKLPSRPTALYRWHPLLIHRFPLYCKPIGVIE